MVDGQVRTIDVTDSRILDAMLSVPRELFVPAASQPLAYLDLDLDVGAGRYLLKAALTAIDAVNKPQFHHQWSPDRIDVEKDFPADLIQQLEAMGYTVKPRESIGRTELIQVLGKKIIAVGDKRGDDDARGY